MSSQRTELQREADALDCDLYRIILRAEALADRIKTAAPELRRCANILFAARVHVRRFMHPMDLEETRGY